MTLVRHTLYMTLRHLRELWRQPWFVAVALVQPVIWLLLFGALFKRVIEIPGFHSHSYIAFLAPGVVVMTAMFNSAWSGMALIEDLNRGVTARFLVSPVEILGTERVEGLVIERNRLDEQQRAVGTGDYETLDVQMVLRSVGYKGVPLADVPFDTRAQVVPNTAGRVMKDGAVVAGEYVTGWIKRGPSGLIGTNKADSVETVKSLLEDAPNLPRAAEGDPEAVDALLRARGVRYVTMEQWLELERYEMALGEAQGRPRVKLVHVEEMLERIAQSGAAAH